VVRYAPPRYYVLFYPPMAGIAALVLDHVVSVVRTIWRNRTARVLLGGFLAYHLYESALHHRNQVTDALLYGATALVALVLCFPEPGRLRKKSFVGWQGTSAVFAVWAIINVLWLGDWLTHLNYTQRDADRWLADNLPPQSVLIGDAAPGLCLNNRFVAVNVIPGLCNDRDTLESFASRPRYVVILDGRRNRAWWSSRYPDVITWQNQKIQFLHLINFAVSVYEVPMDAVPTSPLIRK
jgi:hypothetical protein